LIALSTRHLRGAASNFEDALAPLARRGYRDLVVSLGDVAATPGGAGLPSEWRVIGVADFVTRRESGLSADPAADGLASFDEGARAAAVASILRRAASARAKNSSLVILRLGAIDVPSREEREWKARRDPRVAAEFRTEVRARADKALEIACRSLHEIVRAATDVTFAVEGPAFGYELGFPEDLARVFGEIRAKNLAAWFASGSADLAHGCGLGPDPAAFLEAAAPRLAGLFLSDSDGARDGLVPGRGRVDFRMVTFFLPRRASRVLFLAPGAAVSDLDEAVEYLKDRGIA
jgi:hypothetical protein